MSALKEYFYKKFVKYFLATGVKYARKMRANLSSGLAHDEAITVPILLHHCGTKQSLYQVRMWLPVLEQLGNDVAIVVRELHGLELEEETSIPVYYIPDGSSISSLISAPEVKVVLYTANTGKNIHLVRDVNIKHVFIGHGDSDKLASAHNLFKMYDSSFVAGDAHIDRFKRNNIELPDGYFYKVGRPNVALKVSEIQSTGTVFDKKTVLYAPTWEGAHSDSSYSSVLVMMEQLLERLVATGLRVVVRLHPFTGSNDEEFTDKIGELKLKYQNNESVIFDSESDIYLQMNQSDMLISDVSSVISDYLYFNKPIYITNPHDDELFEETFPIAKCCNILLKNNITYYFNNGIALDEREAVRIDYRQYVMGDSPEKAFSLFHSALYSLAE